MESIVMYRVGCCDPRLAFGSDGCMLKFLAGILHMYVLIDHPTEDMLEKANFDAGAIELGLYAEKDVIDVAIKLEDLPWMDAPYTVHLEHWSDLPEKDVENVQMNLLLVDSSDGKILGIRAMGLSKEFSAKLLLEMKKQSQRSFDHRGYQRQVAQMQERYTAEQIGVKLSSVRYVVSSKV